MPLEGWNDPGADDSERARVRDTVRERSTIGTWGEQHNWMTRALLERFENGDRMAEVQCKNGCFILF